MGPEPFSGNQRAIELVQQRLAQISGWNYVDIARIQECGLIVSILQADKLPENEGRPQ